MIPRMTTGELLKAWREKAGLTQEEFAEVAGVSRGYVGNYERDRASPSVRTILMFIEAIERSWAPFPRVENERLARFFLGPARDGTLIVAKEMIPLGGRR
jgi:transcriptional regulator with XRE-family HTH domain